MVEYADYWPIDWTATGFDSRESALLKYTDMIQQLFKRFERRPTATILDQVWYAFFASGDYQFLKKGFEVAGFPAATLALRKDALLMYETIRSQYMEKIVDAKQQDPNYFISHEIPNVRRAPGVWEQLDEEIRGKMEILETEEADDADIDALINENKQYKFVSDADLQKTPEELAADATVTRGMDLFSKILGGINASEKK